MKTEKMVISSREIGMQEALAATEKLGTECGLERKQMLHLRLLAEELFGMLRGIAGDLEADYWVEYEGKSFQLHMKSNIIMTDEMHDQLLSVSSSGENAAAKGFMGKLRVLIAEALFTRTPYDSQMAAGMSIGMMSMDGPSMQETFDFYWSMDRYMREVKDQMSDSADAAEAWDELEKSIVANIADEVNVCILGSNVEIIVAKSF